MKMRDRKIQRAKEIAAVTKLSPAEYLYRMAFLYHQAGEAEADKAKSQSDYRRARWLRELGERCEE